MGLKRPILRSKNNCWPHCLAFLLVGGLSDGKKVVAKTDIFISCAFPKFRGICSSHSIDLYVSFNL
jgi:hypothetical protein